jgi:hypothetical protein
LSQSGREVVEAEEVGEARVVYWVGAVISIGPP